MTKPDDGCTLMVTDDLTRYFLVPDGVELPFGDLSVRTVLGKRRFVDEAALAAHEVPRAQADARMRAKVESFFASLRDSVSEDNRPTTPPSPAVQRDVEALVNGLRDLMRGVRRALAEDRKKDSPS